MRCRTKRILRRRRFVDGNNVMGSRPDGWWRDRPAAQLRLADDVGAAAQASKREWTVVFDGAPPIPEPPPASPERVRVEYADRKGANAADDRIVELLAALPEGSDAVVYTSDRRLRERAAALGARVEGAGALLRRTAAEAGPKRRPNRDSASLHPNPGGSTIPANELGSGAPALTKETA